ncbi:alpha/beta hydrolase [Selenomonas ruminis]|uniref:alpha/beta hydrolase n=1 Tax=Selenomonas ruminis TaxID=2593411 RepID=UPI0021082AF8|nr:alpha/beta hydrolase [Selenomonas sp. mPRGC5]
MISDAAPLRSVPNTEVPMLFIHGDADKLVPCEMMEKLYAASSAPAKDKLIVAGAGHADAKKTAPLEYYQRVFAFLAKYM